MSEEIEATDLKVGNEIFMHDEWWNVTAIDVICAHTWPYADELDVWTYAVKRPRTAPIHFRFKLAQKVTVK